MSLEKEIIKDMNLKDLDIVYVVKDAVYNEELRYSLRSVDKYFPHNRVWFYGGKPMYFHPDKQVIINQKGKNKWERVRSMFMAIAVNDEITEDFVLFNDDFFVLKPVEKPPVYRYGSLNQLCKRVEKNNNGKPTPYTRSLERTIEALKWFNFPTTNYELHIPMVINRKGLAFVMELYPDVRATRSLYGNIWLGKKDSAPMKDVKIFDRETIPGDWDFVSTEDLFFAEGRVGDFIRNRFPDKSRFER